LRLSLGCVESGHNQKRKTQRDAAVRNEGTWKRFSKQILYFCRACSEDLKTGKIQLPDFQRGWVWEDERIRGVLASVSRSFPIGALMVLETGGETRFHPRLVEGVELAKDVDPELLVLDGQQRLTSLFQATTYGKVVATKNIRKQLIKRWFYIDILRALASGEDREDAIIGVPEDRILRTLTEVKLDLSTRAKEFEKLYFPCEKLFDTFEWQTGYLQHWKFDPAKTELFMRFQAEILQRFQSYQIPVIKLKRAVQKEAVCHVFEKVNTGDRLSQGGKVPNAGAHLP
jgi:hypothetical protein